MKLLGIEKGTLLVYKISKKKRQSSKEPTYKLNNDAAVPRFSIAKIRIFIFYKIQL